MHVTRWRTVIDARDVRLFSMHGKREAAIKRPMAARFMPKGWRLTKGQNSGAV